MNMYKMAQPIHTLAVKNGWWEGDKDDREVFAMIHAELSEAIEEYRNGKPMVYHVDGKPEGIAVELIDACIRMLDWLGSKKDAAIRFAFMTAPKVNIDAEARAMNMFMVSADTQLPVLVFILHKRLMVAYDLSDDSLVSISAIAFIGIIFGWLRTHGVDPEAIMLEKHEYNKTRPHRHGNKLC